MKLLHRGFLKIAMRSGDSSRFLKFVRWIIMISAALFFRSIRN